MQTTITTNSYFRGADLRITEGDRSATVNVKEGSPAVEVKDHAMYHADGAFSEAYDIIGERRAEVLYEQAQHDFWRVIAPSVASEHGYDESDIGQAGRSGGWLTVDGLSFWDYIVEDGSIPEADASADEDTREEYAAAIAERERFFRFALDITAAVTTASEQYIADVKQAARVGALVDAVWRD